jgi:APA family basic amino acid/polyamine antiporter
MASRVIYGMAAKHLLSTPLLFLPLINRLAALSSMTRTPITATIFIAILVLSLALFFPVETLAKITSTVVFIIFFFVNSALWKLKQGRLKQDTQTQNDP